MLQNTPTREQAIEFLLQSPFAFGHMVGFDKLTELHNNWIISMMSDGDDETLQAHRGSYKTTCVSLALAVNIIIRPQDRTLFMRKTDDDIKEIISQVKKILEHPVTAYFVYVIYGIQIKMTKSDASSISTNLSTDIKGTPQLTGIGTGGSLTGKHFDRIFTDDIVNVNDRISKAERDRTKIIYQELQNIKNRGGRIFNTGTPWHKDDCFSIMPEPKRYDCYSTGLISKTELEEIRASMIPSLFAANYELRHIASEDVIFISPKTGADPALAEQGESHIDAAYGGEDYTAYTECKRRDGKYYVFGKLWRKHVDDVEDTIIEYHKAFNAGKFYCENNADKGYLAKDLQKKGQRVQAYHEKMNKFIKIASILKPIWKDVYFVEGTDPEYINQICDYNEDAEHDDAPDSLASMIRIITRRDRANVKRNSRRGG